MKKSMKWFGLAAMVLFTTSCVNEDPAYKQEEELLTNEEVGYVDFGTGALSVLFDSDTDQSPIVTTPGAQTRTELKDGDEAERTEDYLVSIRNTQTNHEVFSGTFAKLDAEVRKAKESNKPGMEIPVGSYNITATSNTSTNREPHAIQRKPCYWGQSEEPMVVKKGETSQAAKVICKLKNIKTTVEITADLLEKLDQTKEISAAVGIEAPGGSKLEYIYTNQEGIYPKYDWAAKPKTDPIYFAAQKPENNTMFFTFTATLKGAEKGLTLNKEIPGVKGGQWRKIRMGIKYNTEGNLVITVNVSTLMIDETINIGDVNASTNNWKEAGYDDPETMPSLQWPGVDLTQPIQLANLSGSQEALTISAPNGMKSIALTCNTTSTDEALNNAMTAMTVADLLTVTSNATLSEYGIPFGSTLKGATSATVDMNKLIAKLRDKTEGSCTFRFQVTDQTGASIDQSVTLQMGKGVPPQIAGEGFNIDNWQEVAQKATTFPLENGTTSDHIQINVTSSIGLTNLWVEINSPELIALLNGAMPSKFDLCNIDPTNTGFLGQLNMFGFPYNDRVKNQTNVPFTISSDIYGMLTNIIGDHEFILTAIDQNGEVTKSLKIRVAAN